MATPPYTFDTPEPRTPEAALTFSRLALDFLSGTASASCVCLDDTGATTGGGATYEITLSAADQQAILDIIVAALQAQGKIPPGSL